MLSPFIYLAAGLLWNLEAKDSGDFGGEVAFASHLYGRIGRRDLWTPGSRP